MSLKILGLHSPFQRYPGETVFNTCGADVVLEGILQNSSFQDFQAGILRAIVSLDGTAQPSCMVSRDSTKMNDKVNLKN